MHEYRGAQPPAVARAYPSAPPGTVIDDYHGTSVPDPYRWLESIDAPSTQRWVNAQAALPRDTRAIRACSTSRCCTPGVAVSGSDWAEWHMRTVVACHDLPDITRHTKYDALVLSGDGLEFFYSAFPAPATGTELTAPDLGNAGYVPVSRLQNDSIADILHA